MENIPGQNTAPVEPRPIAPSAKTNQTMFLWGLLGFIVVVVVVLGGIGAYRVYAKGATDSFTSIVAKVLRLPALKVNGVTVLYSTYVDDLKAITTLSDYDKQSGGPTAALTDEQKSDQVLWRLANNIFLDDLAKKMNVTVADEDVAALKTQMLAQFKGGEAEANTEVLKRYGWTLKEYENKVMRPFVLQSKLDEKFTTDNSLREDIRAKAQDVLNQIKAGANFEDMAKKYGEDGTAAKGGDLGTFGKGEMVPQFETAAFALKKGETSQELVETSYGYHIIRVDDVQGEKVSAHHIIFLFPSLEKSLDAALKSALQADTIRLYPKIHNPFTEALNPTTATQ
ncbi:MAG: peptidylprolyl isomerase [Patescibacteria group bacterium]|nr:peptidylprolyl isomerase [Patescibacteria group bacterium]